VFCSIVSNVYNLVGLKSVIRGRSKDHYFNTTYTKSFKLPPVFNMVSNIFAKVIKVVSNATFVFPNEFLFSLHANLFVPCK
jgi:hypothetical protein